MPLYERETVQLPKGETVDIRELSVEQLREADAVGTENVTAQMNMLPQGIIDEQIEQQKAEGSKGEQEKQYGGHDPAIMLRYGVTGWSFEGVEFNEENVANMGARKADIVARAIFALSVPEAGESDASSTKSPEDESEQPSSEPTSSDAPEA